MTKTNDSLGHKVVSAKQEVQAEQKKKVIQRRKEKNLND
jgi:hypothetical protein